MSIETKQDFSVREYTINGKKCFQTALSPFQMTRLMLSTEKIKNILKEKGIDVPNIKEAGKGVEIDMNFILTVIENNPEIVSDLMNVILKNPATGKPGYVDSYFTADDVAALDATTMLEVVADFFTLTDVFKLYLNYLKISNRMNVMKKVFQKN